MARSALVLTTSLALVLGTSAPAAASHSTLTLEPATAVLYLSRPALVEAQIDGLAQLDPRPTSFWVECDDCPDPGSAPGTSMTPVRKVDDDSWTRTFGFAASAPPGRWAVGYYGPLHDADDGDPDGIEEGGAFLMVKRNTTLSFNVTPEDVSAGGTLLTYGRLMRMTPEGYVGYANKTLTLEFKPVGEAFASHATVTTDAAGQFRKLVLAERDGTWRVTFGGTRFHDGERSRHDYIDVR